MYMYRFNTKSLFTSLAILSIVLSIFGSFGLHALQVVHFHPSTGNHQEASSPPNEEHGSKSLLGLGEYMHASDKKLFLSITPAILLSITTLALIYGSFTKFIEQANIKFILLLRRRKIFWTNTSNYLWLLLARGILNPKLY